MKIVFIGAGNVASNLSLKLKEKGFDIVQIYSKTLSSAEMLAKKLNCEFVTESADITKNADVYFYTLKDRYLGRYIEKNRVPSAIHIHMAGSVSIDVFEGLAENYGVIYPLQTFSKAKEIVFEGIPFFLEANNDKTKECVTSIAKSLSDQVYFANSAQRQKIHISAVFACNFVNHMYLIAADLVENSQFTFDVLRPLIKETADKINYLHPINAQTGPAVRYDKKVINQHIEKLHNEDLKEIYKIISKSIYKKAKQKENQISESES